MSAFVKSVEYVEITLTDAGPTSTNLTKSQTIADCVPFYTVNLDGSVNDIVDRRHVDVFFEAGPKVTAQRDGSTGTVVVGVFVVEFDTSGDISVEQGTWDLLSSETNTTETIAPVTTTKAFCIISYRNAATTDDFDEAQVAVKFNSGTQLSFDRNTSGAAVTGRYYVIATSGTDFSVQHIPINMPNAGVTATVTIALVTLSKTFVYGTHLTNEASDDVRDGSLIFDVQDDETLRVRRAFDSFSDTPAAGNNTCDGEAQIVSAGDSEFSVERNECDWGDALTKTVNIATIDQTKAIIVSGGYQGIMSSSETAGLVDGDYATLKYNTDSQIIGTRGVNTNPDGTTFFEAVEFALTGVAPPTINLVMAPYIPA